jgi:hypothetical protein
MKRVVINAARTSMVLLLLILSLPLHAQPKASTLYSNALSAMRANDYDSAVKLFTQAQQAGLNTSTLHYNSGVAQYKLGHYQQAKAEFIKAEADSDNSALVHYNLGLSSYRLEQKTEARQWFVRVAAETTNQQLVDMADEMVARLDEKDEKRPEPVTEPRPWSLSADLLYGHDDNVTLENSDLAQVTSLKDGYLDLYAAARYQLSGDRDRGNWALLSASSLQYQQYDSYDYTQYDLSLFRDSNFGVLDTRVGVRISRSEVGGSNYLQKYTVRLQGDYPLNDSQTLRARYDLSRYDPIDSSYSYLAGLKGNLSLESLWHNEGRKFKLGYELENNSREDYELGTTFISYSAVRHELSASATLPVAEGWQLTLGSDYRKSRYNDIDVIAGVATYQREDDRWRGNVGAEYRLNRYFDLIGEYHYTNNDSNVVSRRYRRNQYTLGVRGYF